jgi:hypothetical protein
LFRHINKGAAAQRRNGVTAQRLKKDKRQKSKQSGDPERSVGDKDKSKETRAPIVYNFYLVTFIFCLE